MLVLESPTESYFTPANASKPNPAPSPAQSGVNMSPTEKSTPEPPLRVDLLPSVNVAVARSVPPKNPPKSSVKPFPGCRTHGRSAPLSSVGLTGRPGRRSRGTSLSTPGDARSAGGPEATAAAPTGPDVGVSSSAAGAAPREGG